MNNPTSKNLHSVYFQNLDACRAIAALAVFLVHFSNEIIGLFPTIREETAFKAYYLFAGKGGLGVNFFFVLSGFLITFLIYNERKNYGYFHLGKFLVRRTLRIWPLYFLIGLIGFVLFPLIFSDYATNHSALNYFLFLANFDEIWNGLNDPINFLTSPWSVAVEEQFYLFWGIALYLLLKVKSFKLEYLLAILYAISFYYRWKYWNEPITNYYHTLTACQDILMGSFIGVSVFREKKWIQEIQALPKMVNIIFYLIGFALCIGKNKLFAGELIVFERFVLSFFFAYVILDQIGGKNSLFKLGELNALNYLGKISYGLYMYHLVIMYLVLRYIDFQPIGIAGTFPLFFTLSLLLTVALSTVSYRYFESKFLSLKPKHTRK